MTQTLGLGKRSTALREIRSIVSALLARFESTLSRSLFPVLLAQYQTRLPDKKLLQAKLHESCAANVGEGDAA